MWVGHSCRPSPAARRGFFWLRHAEQSSMHDASSRNLEFFSRVRACPEPSRRGSCERHVGAMRPHARSLVPLVRARDFGMTPVLENFGDKLRATSKNRVGRTFLSDQALPQDGAFI